MIGGKSGCTPEAMQHKCSTLGIDLAKSIFRLHGVDARGVAVLRRQLTRKQLDESVLPR